MSTQMIYPIHVISKKLENLMFPTKTNRSCKTWCPACYCQFGCAQTCLNNIYTYICEPILDNMDLFAACHNAAAFHNRLCTHLHLTTCPLCTVSMLPQSIYRLLIHLQLPSNCIRISHQIILDIYTYIRHVTIRKPRHTKTIDTITR